MDEIRKNIVSAMTQLGVTGAEVSRRLNKNRAYINQFLSGKQQHLPYEERLVLAEFLKMKPQSLGISPPSRQAAVSRGGFQQDAEPYMPSHGHYLASAPKHFWMLRMTSNSVDQHPDHAVRKGDVVVFDLNRTDLASLKPLTIVALQMCRRDELTATLGTAVRLFMPPNKFVTNSSEMNEIWTLDDDERPFVPVLRGSFESVIRGLN